MSDAHPDTSARGLPTVTQTGDEAQFWAGVIYRGREQVWHCPHRHLTPDAAQRCAERWNR